MSIRQNWKGRVADTEYYLLANGRDPGRAMPIRVSLNGNGHMIAAEIPDADGKLTVSADTLRYWIEHKDSPWLVRTDEAGFLDSLSRLRRDMAGASQVVPSAAPAP